MNMMEAGEDSECGRSIRRMKEPSLDDMCQAADLSVEIVSRICEQEEKMIATGRRDSADHKALLELTSGAMRFRDNVCNLTHYKPKRVLLRTEGKMETGGGSTGKSEIKHEKSRKNFTACFPIVFTGFVKCDPLLIWVFPRLAALPAVSPPMPMAVGGWMGGFPPFG